MTCFYIRPNISGYFYLLKLEDFYILLSLPKIIISKLLK